jgi:hypothetical protein
MSVVGVSYGMSVAHQYLVFYYICTLGVFGLKKKKNMGVFQLYELK